MANFKFHMPATFRVLVQVSDVLSGVPAHALGADVLAHQCSRSYIRGTAIFILLECDDISIDLSKDKGGIVLEHEVAFLDGPERDGAAAVHS